jgi:saccharopine dehydrogenase-like NADP-dependent oxidoreductase
LTIKIFIAGCGAVSHGLIQYLERDKQVKQILCCDKNLERATKFLSENYKKTSLVKGDSSVTSEIVKLARGFDIIINASLPEFNLKLMRAAYRIGADYMDFCSYAGGQSKKLKELSNPEQFCYDGKFKKKKLLGLINAGVAAGISNIMVAECASRLSEVDSVKIVLLEEQKSRVPIFSWSPEVILDEIVAPPVVFRNGKFALEKPFYGKETIKFPAPIGKKRVAGGWGDEIITLPRYIKARNFEMKACGSELELETKIFKGKNLDYIANNAIVTPTPEEVENLVKNGIIKSAVFAILVEAVGMKGGRKETEKMYAIFPDAKQIVKKCSGATYISWPTGFAAYAFLKTMPKIKETGVMAPECLEGKLRMEIFDMLKNEGVRMNKYL